MKSVLVDNANTTAREIAANAQTTTKAALDTTPAEGAEHVQVPVPL